MKFINLKFAGICLLALSLCLGMGDGLGPSCEVGANCVAGCNGVVQTGPTSFDIPGGTTTQFTIDYAGDIGGCQFSYISTNTNVGDVEGAGNSFVIYTYNQGMFSINVNVSSCTNNNNCLEGNTHAIDFNVQ